MPGREMVGEAVCKPFEQVGNGGGLVAGGQEGWWSG